MSRYLYTSLQAPCTCWIVLQHRADSYHLPKQASKLSEGQQRQGAICLLKSESGCALHRGKRWTAIRRASDPLFHANAMKSYMPIFKLAVERFLAKLEQTKPGESLEIVHPLKDLGLEVIGASVFGCACQLYRFEASMK